MIGIVQHVNQENKLFSVVLEDGTYSVCICKDIHLIKLGDLFFGGFQHYGMNYIEAETAGKHFLVDIIAVSVSESTAKHKLLPI